MNSQYSLFNFVDGEATTILAMGDDELLALIKEMSWFLFPEISGALAMDVASTVRRAALESLSQGAIVVDAVTVAHLMTAGLSRTRAEGLVKLSKKMGWDGDKKGETK